MLRTDSFHLDALVPQTRVDGGNHSGSYGGTIADIAAGSDDSRERVGEGCPFRAVDPGGVRIPDRAEGTAQPGGSADRVGQEAEPAEGAQRSELVVTDDPGGKDRRDARAWAREGLQRAVGQRLHLRLRPGREESVDGIEQQVHGAGDPGAEVVPPPLVPAAEAGTEPVADVAFRFLVPVGDFAEGCREILDRCAEAA